MGWRCVCLALWLTLAAGGQGQTGKTVIVSSDIDHFWAAYDAGRPGHRVDALNRLYFGSATDGLKDFLRLRIESAQQLADAIDRYPRFYSSIREATRAIPARQEEIQVFLKRFRQLYPDAHIPNIYLVIGRLSSGGTTSPAGLLIGAEVFALGPGVDASEIDPPFRKAMGTMNKLPLIVIHELVHAQQKLTAPRSLLTQALLEGAADFITEEVTGSSINAYAKSYAEQHRDTLFRDFAMDLAEHPDDVNRWMYNYSSVIEEPADLGYWIGAQICRDFYNSSRDKQVAFRMIMTMAHPDEIVKNSRYAWILQSGKEAAVKNAPNEVGKLGQ